ncbi:MAG: PqqD family protein [Pyrinomonadaceae bacterium]
MKVLPDEVLVYDLERHQVHCLNRAAAFVWEHCDGRATVTEVAALLRKELKNAADEEVVWLALNGLRRAGLLRADAGGKTEPTRRVSRRDLIRKLAAAAALLPLVTSIVVPEAAAAQSINCASFTTQQSCENPLKACSGQQQFFCRWRFSNGQNRCICTNS